MQNLVEELMQKAGLSQQQSEQAIEVIKNFVMNQVPPAFAPMVDNFFQKNDAEGGATGGGIQDMMGKLGF